MLLDCFEFLHLYSILCHVNPFYSLSQKVFITMNYHVELQYVRFHRKQVFTSISIIDYLNNRLNSQLYKQNNSSFSKVREYLRLGQDISAMVNFIQRERDMSALYVSSISPDSKRFLVSSYWSLQKKTLCSFI